MAFLPIFLLLEIQVAFVFGHSPNASAAVSSSAPEASQYSIHGVILATTLLAPEDVISNAGLYKSFAEMIGTIVGQNSSSVVVNKTCLVGCWSHDSPAGLLEKDSKDALKTSLLEIGVNATEKYFLGVVSISFAVDELPRVSNASEEKAVLQRFSRYQVFDDFLMVYNLRPSVVVLKTSTSVATYKTPDYNINARYLDIQPSLAGIFGNMPFSKVCITGVLFEALKAIPYPEAMLKVNKLISELEMDLHHQESCRDYAISLLRMMCIDQDEGVSDAWGGSCYFYSLYGADKCGHYDDSDFIAEERCCICGGGNGNSISQPSDTHQSNGAPEVDHSPRGYCASQDTLLKVSDSLNLSCASYVDNFRDCGLRDTDLFVSRELCCACGGGNVSMEKLPSTSPLVQSSHASESRSATMEWVYFSAFVSGTMKSPAEERAWKHNVTMACRTALAEYLAIGSTRVGASFGPDSTRLLGIVYPSQNVSAAEILQKLEGATISQWSKFASGSGSSALVFRNFAFGIHEEEIEKMK